MYLTWLLRPSAEGCICSLQIDEADTSDVGIQHGQCSTLRTNEVDGVDTVTTGQWRRLDTTLITRATMTAPNKYERSVCERAILRIPLAVRFVSET